MCIKNEYKSSDHIFHIIFSLQGCESLVGFISVLWLLVLFEGQTAQISAGLNPRPGTEETVNT